MEQVKQMIEAEGVEIISVVKRCGIVKIKIHWKNYLKIRCLEFPAGYEVIF